jgi:hypothetical protein
MAQASATSCGKSTTAVLNWFTLISTDIFILFTLPEFGLRPNFPVALFYPTTVVNHFTSAR